MTTIFPEPRTGHFHLPGFTLDTVPVPYHSVSLQIQLWRELVAEAMIIPAAEPTSFQKARQTYVRDQEAYLRHLAYVYPDEAFALLVQQGRYLEAVGALLHSSQTREGPAQTERPVDAGQTEIPHLEASTAQTVSAASTVMSTMDEAQPTLSSTSQSTIKFPGMSTPLAWTTELRELAVSIMRESVRLLPSGEKFASTVGHAVLLLCSKACGVHFLDPMLDNISLAFFQQLIAEGIIKEPQWIRPGASKSRSLYKGWNDFFKAHVERGIRAKYVPEGQTESVFIYGLNTSGAAYFHSSVLKAGISFDVLTDKLQYIRTAIGLPAALAAELQMLPDNVTFDQVVVAS